MSKTLKLLEALLASKQVLSETSVHAEDGKVIITRNNGTTEDFVPVDMTAQEVVDKFHSILKHSEGRAWQWLRKIRMTSPINEGEYNFLYVVRLTDNGELGEYVEYNSEDTTEEELIDELSALDDVVGIYGGVTNSGPIDPKWLRDRVTEAEDVLTSCPYQNALSKLINEETDAVKDYDEVILLINESDLPQKAQILEILQHIKDEELHHVVELKNAIELLTAPEQPDELAVPVEPTSTEVPLNEPSSPPFK